MRLDDVDYELPSDRIAQHPTARRRDARLLRWRADGGLEHLPFEGIRDLLRSGDLLVVNDTRVFPARLFGAKVEGGARVEVLLVRPLAAHGPSCWEAMVRPGRRLREGHRVRLEGGALLTLGATLEAGHREVRFDDATRVAELCHEHGHVPLPPYIDRADTRDDRERYQTVFARAEGSVAAPTAGLHFDPELLAELETHGVGRVEVTLHVGPGTFRSPTAAELAARSLHPERFRVSAPALAALHAQRKGGGRIVAVGTTACRTLESLPDPEVLDCEQAIEDETRLMIAPGHRFRWVDVLLTNFHLPRSSLLLLVAAFAGDRWRDAYATAVREGYRFYSYGDANWIEPSGGRTE